MRRYHGVRRHREVEAVAKAIELSGARVLAVPDPTVAPFDFRVMTAAGEILELICYVFSANKYRQAGRPSDEHRLQVKYGSDFDTYHDIFIATGEHRVTLMLGYHLEEDMFVAVDPEMHNPTWFSRSIEFKDEHVERVKDLGWYGWERDRSAVRRKQLAPRESLKTEVLLGFLPVHFMRYVQFERIATGMDPGERLLFCDRLTTPATPELVTEPHPLELELGLDARQILDMIQGAFRLKVAVRGSAAEEHLHRKLVAMSDLDDVRPLDLDGQPDFEIVHRGRTVRIECKNVGRRRTREGLAKVDFQRTRAATGDPCSRYYATADFEILAACMHPVTETWDFEFCRTTGLSPHARCIGKLAANVTVAGRPLWTPSLVEILTG